MQNADECASRLHAFANHLLARALAAPRSSERSSGHVSARHRTCVCGCRAHPGARCASSSRHDPDPSRPHGSGSRAPALQEAQNGPLPKLENHGAAVAELMKASSQHCRSNQLTEPRRFCGFAPRRCPKRRTESRRGVVVRAPSETTRGRATFVGCALVTVRADGCGLVGRSTSS
jgi:hypothetical protein